MDTPVFKRKNIVIIGGAGFVGSHLCDSLIKENNIICIDNFVTSSQVNISHLLRNQNFVFVKHDITQPIELESIPELAAFDIGVAGIQEVYNLATPTSPKNFEHLKIDTARTNSIGTINALEIARKYTAKIVHGSSSVIYGGVDEDNYYYKEEEFGSVDILTPRSCYDEGKRFAETLVYTYGEQYGLEYKIARIFRSYGPRMMLNNGHMIPDFISNALDGQPLRIFGNEDFTSPFCYISDLVEGLIKLMDSTYVGAMNLGSPDNYLVKDVAEHLVSLVDSSSEIVFEPPLKFTKKLGLPNITRAKETLGWFPIVTMSDGLKRTIDYTIASKSLSTFIKE